MKRTGLVVSRHRREVVIESDTGDTLNALVSGRRLNPLVGDEVSWRAQPDGTAVIEDIRSRQSLLERIDNRGQPEGVAANVSLIAVVIAPSPAPDWALVDRYLVAAELIPVGAVLVRNKSDVEDLAVDEAAQRYTGIGYELIETCTRSGHGIGILARRLRGERAVLVGQSGVGKSSLINALLDSDVQTVGTLSTRRALGRHTTTASMLHRLPGGGEIIDSPGVRRYAPWLAEPADVARGFVEFRRFADQCRFNDCRHMEEPGCAVVQAVREHRISDARYQSYLALRATLERLRTR